MCDDFDPGDPRDLPFTKQPAAEAAKTALAHYELGEKPWDAPLCHALGLTFRENGLLWTLTARGLIRAKRKGCAGGDRRGWPRELLLAVILENVWENQRALTPISKVLSGAGVPLRAWLIECRNRLYDGRGRETYEPVFSREYLLRVADAMWMLSTTVFAHGTFSYDTLAAQMRAPDLKLVRKAVRRIATICRSGANGGSMILPFWVGQERWRWNIQKCTPQEPCAYMSLQDVKERLDGTVTPT